MNVWCKHVDMGKGCNRYETRPDSCRNFICAWLDERYNLPIEFKPERIKAVIRATPEDSAPGVIIYLDTGYPGRHLEEPLKGFIEWVLQQQLTVRVTHLGKWWTWDKGWKRIVPIEEYK